MAGEGVFEGVATEVDQFNALGVEEAVTQADIDRIGQRSANASENLPCKAAVGIVDRRGEVRIRCDFIAGTSNADTTADITLQAIVGTEVHEAVEHEGKSVRVTACRVEACRR